MRLVRSALLILLLLAIGGGIARAQDAEDDLLGGQLSLAGSAVDLLPEGRSNAVEIVLVGTHNGLTYPMVVQNNTPEPVRAVSVTVTVRDAAGKLVATGRDHGFVPDILAPGDYTMGYVSFGEIMLPDDGAFVFTASGEAIEDLDDGPLDLVVQDASYLDHMIVGTISNPYDEAVASPIRVLALCLSEGGELVGTVEGSADDDMLPVDGTTSFAERISGEIDCSRFVIAAHGWTS